ncbi:MAG: class I SAM-dependent methyltransferase [Flavobacteriales bacterium]|nr:class I SAM-dependent methyltransferase [Flavobacteriales bacterium]
MYSIINQDRALYASWLEKAVNHSNNLLKINKVACENNHPNWVNGFLPGLDIIMLYTLIAELNPKKYIEVGSGNSTKVVYKAKSENNLATQIISIDPQPRAEIDHLADEVIRKPFENLDYESILSLEAGDVLFIDNSHRILPNSDSMVFFLEILPNLKPGVIVHIHDIYLPYDYPQFMCDRFYNEQYGLAMYLMANSDKYQTIMPNYFVFEDPELHGILKPLWENPKLNGVEKHGGSYWLKIGENYSSK